MIVNYLDIKQKISSNRTKLLTLFIIVASIISIFIPISSVFAADSDGTNILSATTFDGTCTSDDCSIISRIINPAIAVLSAGVGLVVTVMIIIAGIQYTMAGDDPQKVMAAKSKIQNAVLALVTYIFFFGLLQWLWPGGII